jgi:multidrug resistance efflux pump
MRFFRNKSILGIAVGSVVALALVIGIVGFAGSRGRHDLLLASAQGGGGEGAEGESRGAIAAKTIRPRQDPSFSATVEQPAYVAAYYKAELMSRVAGPVKSVVHDKGDHVKADEVLLVVDIPDVQEEVAQKEAVVKQRQGELDLAKANLKTAEAGVKVAEETIKVKQSDIQRADASRNFREKELKRYTGLSSGPNPAVTQDIVDERKEFYEIAVAGSETARFAVKDAEAELQKAQAKLEAARADISVAESLIGVARKDRDKAQALLDLATIRAPFAGEITVRNADPGTFVQNAASAHTGPLFTVIRDDIVTVYMKVPDTYASLVTGDTEAIIQMENLPGVVIRGKVTRYARSLDNPAHDRTMRVEVDLYNGSAAQYKEFLEREKALGNADLKSKTLPVFPQVEGKDLSNQPLRLIDGQYGKMRLVLKDYAKSFLLPRGAVFSEGGTSYVFLVKDGRALKVPVEIQANDGERMKVVLLEKSRGQTVKRELTAADEVVSSNQGELSDGQTVKTTPVEWK